MIPLLNVGWQIPPEYPLGDRDVDVLSVINDENLTVFTFDGLKRRLGLHPETLSRILTRLEEEGLLKKKADGYKVSSTITKLKLHESGNGDNHVLLLQTYLPSNVQVQHLIQNLKGKWFGILRWFGLSETDHGITLKWVTEDGGTQINANIEDNTFMIKAKFIRENNLNLALHAAYQLMSQISGLCRGPRTLTARQVNHSGNSNIFIMPA